MLSKRILASLVIGVLVTFVLFSFSAASSLSGWQSVAQILCWQNTLLQALVRAPNIGTSAHPVYEGTPDNFLVFILSIPLGFIIYGVIAYFVIGRLQRRQKTPDS